MPAGLLREATPDERAASKRRVRDVLARLDALDADGIQMANDLAADLRADLMGTFQLAKGAWSASQLRSLEDVVNQRVTRWSTRFGNSLTDGLEMAHDLGVELVDTGLVVQGQIVQVPRGLQLDRQRAIQRARERAVAQLRHTLQPRLRDAVRASILKGESADQFLADLASDSPRGLFHSIRKATESRVRTQLVTVQARSTQKRMEEVEQRSPELGLKKVYVAIYVGTAACPVCRADDGRVFGVREGPRLPRHPHCRCSYLPRLRPKPAPANPAPPDAQSPAPDRGPHEPAVPPEPGRKLFRREVRKVWAQERDITQASDRYLEQLKPWFDEETPPEESDFRLMAQYLRSEPTTWNRIRRGGPAGFSLTLHEFEEIRVKEELGLDPLASSNRYRRRSHGSALLKEAEFLLALARSEGYNISSIGPIIANNLLSGPDGVHPDDPDMIQGWRSDVRLADKEARRLGKPRVQDNPEEKAEAQRFFRWLLREGFEE